MRELCSLCPHPSKPHGPALVAFAVRLSCWVVQLPLQCGGVSLRLEQFLLITSSVEESFFTHPVHDPTPPRQTVFSCRLDTEPQSALLCGTSTLPIFFFTVLCAIRVGRAVSLYSLLV